jgi:hypothetical protein
MSRSWQRDKPGARWPTNYVGGDLQDSILDTENRHRLELNDDWIQNFSSRHEPVESTRSGSR